MKDWIDLLLQITGVIGIFAVFYNWSRAREKRLADHRKIVDFFDGMSKRSYVEQVKYLVSSIIIPLMDKIYGPVKDATKISEYATRRAWQASFTIVVLYIVVIPFALLFSLTTYVYLVSPETAKTEGVLNLVITSFTIMMGVILIVFFTLRRRIKTIIQKIKIKNFLLQALTQDTKISPVLLLISIASLTHSILFFHNYNVLNYNLRDIASFVMTTGMVLLIFYVVIYNVWKLGAKGLFVSFCVGMFSSLRAVWLYLSIRVVEIWFIPVFYYEDGSILNVPLIVYPLFAISVSLGSKRTPIKLLFWLRLLLTPFALIFLSKIGALPTILSPHYFFMIMSLYIVLGLGLFVANSVGDLISVCFSRYFFCKISNSMRLKELLKFLGLDIGIALVCAATSAFIVVISGIIGIFIANGIHLWSPKFGEIHSLFASGFLTAAGFAFSYIVSSPVCFVQDLIGISSIQQCFENPERLVSGIMGLGIGGTDNSQRQFALMFVFLFASSLVPTILNIIVVTIAVLLKSSEGVVGYFCIRTHKYLLETERSGHIVAFLFVTFILVMYWVAKIFGLI